MPTAVVSLPLPASPAVVGKAADSIATSDSTSGGMDFAALLLGQMFGGTTPETDALLAASTLPLAETDAALDTGLTETGTETVTDPALLLAAMGLSLEPADVRQALKSIGTASGFTPLHARGLAEHSNIGASIAGGDTAALPLSISGEESGLTAVTSLQGTANFAGFEQKLAESMEGGMPHVQQTNTHAAPQAQHTRNASEPLQMNTPLREPAWPTEFGQKLVWMATQDRQNAQITLNPPQMGPIEISLNVKNDQATAVFVSGNPEVREALESALPRLREMLAGVGVELGQTNVSAESFQQARDNNGHGRERNHHDSQGDEQAGSLMPVTGQTAGAVRAGNGLVDTFV